MLDPTPSRNLKSFSAKAASHVIRRMPVRRRRVSMVAFLAVFLVAAMVWGSVDWVLSRGYGPGVVPADPGTMARKAQIDAAVKEILERPLFTGGRIPAAPPPTPEQLEAAQRPVLKNRLTGISVLTGARVALFASDGNKYVSVREGEKIDGFKVKSIEADRVILASRFSEQIVQPSRGLAPTVRNTHPIDLGNVDPDKPS